MIPVYRGLRSLPPDFGPAVAAIGNFDGVHLGHREILSAVVAEARQREMKAVAITFDPHPEQFLRPDHAPGLLTPMDHRIRLLSETGIDAVVILLFDEALARLTARQFVEWVLGDALGIAGLHEGGNFRFGNKAEAGVLELADFGRELGFRLTVHPAVHTHGLEVSSSAIREMVSAGDMRRARWMLGRPFSIVSTQKRDRGVGSQLLVPTINFAAYEGLVPAYGIYVTQLRIGQNRRPARCFQAVTSLGMRPTFEGAGFSIETHILNFEPVEMDETTPLELEFLVRLRDEEKFDSTEALKVQIMKDIARAQRYFRRATP
ncbi:bifunctional riboflavin kinase/FAD synthetase [Occallatibacter riparius]|uniref:Riboflavin biosynthesis protein n=1 Tax=Occallatibacter riparius TaxID=1002689 RepID=A0A9J7BVK5_9BACT|nr:bifunctional riboflavin kinase/FAD synthetase [Occallatibacter riparius]UWZ84926.1 bifunctional riboflavin kinase/FAD synthetase [Occallatibacter riparius]